MKPLRIQAAQAVRDKAVELNAAIKECYRLGLTVRLDTHYDIEQRPFSREVRVLEIKAGDQF